MNEPIGSDDAKDPSSSTPITVTNAAPAQCASKSRPEPQSYPAKDLPCPAFLSPMRRLGPALHSNQSSASEHTNATGMNHAHHLQVPPPANAFLSPPPRRQSCSPSAISPQMSTASHVQSRSPQPQLPSTWQAQSPRSPSDLSIILRTMEAKAEREANMKRMQEENESIDKFYDYDDEEEDDDEMDDIDVEKENELPHHHLPLPMPRQASKVDMGIWDEIPPLQRPPLQQKVNESYQPSQTNKSSGINPAVNKRSSMPSLDVLPRFRAMINAQKQQQQLHQQQPLLPPIQPTRNAMGHKLPRDKHVAPTTTSTKPRSGWAASFDMKPSDAQKPSNKQYQALISSLQNIAQSSDILSPDAPTTSMDDDHEQINQRAINEPQQPRIHSAHASLAEPSVELPPPPQRQQSHTRQLLKRVQQMNANSKLQQRQLLEEAAMLQAKLDEGDGSIERKSHGQFELVMVVGEGENDDGDGAEDRSVNQSDENCLPGSNDMQRAERNVHRHEEASRVSQSSYVEYSFFKPINGKAPSVRNTRSAPGSARDSTATADPSTSRRQQNKPSTAGSKAVTQKRPSTARAGPSATICHPDVSGPSPSAQTTTTTEDADDDVSVVALAKNVLASRPVSLRSSQSTKRSTSTKRSSSSSHNSKQSSSRPRSTSHASSNVLVPRPQPQPTAAPTTATSISSTHASSTKKRSTTPTLPTSTFTTSQSRRNNSKLGARGNASAASSRLSTSHSKSAAAALTSSTSSTRSAGRTYETNSMSARRSSTSQKK